MNPTNDVLEKRMAALEGGIAGLVVSAGSADQLRDSTLAQIGDNIISTPQLLRWYLHPICSHAAKPRNRSSLCQRRQNLESLAVPIDEKPKAVYCESIGNPAGNIIDLERVAELARYQGTGDCW